VFRHRKREEPRGLAASFVADRGAGACAVTATGSSSRDNIRKERGKYYYFEDVFIPTDLEYDQKKSYVYETPQFKVERSTSANGAPT